MEYINTLIKMKYIKIQVFFTGLRKIEQCIELSFRKYWILVMLSSKIELP